MSGLQSFIRTTLQGTEASNDPGIAYSASWSTGRSGLSYGYMQNDIGNNPDAQVGLVNILVADGIAATEAKAIVARAASSASLSAISTQDLATINGALSRQHDAVDAVDNKRVAYVTQKTLEVVTTAKNGVGAGVLNPSNPDYAKALGRIASWINRTNEPNTLKDWLEGKPVTLNEPKPGDPPERLAVNEPHPLQLDHPPTLQDIDDYLQKTREYSPINQGGNGSNFSGWIDNIGNAVSDALSALTGLISDALGFLGKLAEGTAEAAEIPAPPTKLSMGFAMQFCRDYMMDAISTITNSPIALDLGSNGLNLISKEDSSAFFDMDMDGFREKVQWVGAGDAFLARDVDGNGRIDDRTELFGDTEGFADGWAKLATLDSNSDGIISADDAAWGSLLVWRDLDGDGFSDEGELVSLAEAGVASISLDADAALASTFTRTDGTTGQAQDIFLDQAPMLTTYGGDFTLDPETRSSMSASNLQ